jgi:DNA-binding beta-propeller fold protein YncE
MFTKPLMRLKLLYVFFLYSFLSCNGQKLFGLEHLQLDKTIEMPGVVGRIDHMAVNLTGQILYVAALGNNSVEVVDLKEGKLVQSIKGLDEPQGVAYIPETNELVVANGGNGDCIFFNAATFEKLVTIHLDDDADNIRYNALSGKIYIGYGNGGIAEVDINHQLLREVKLNAHPEGFQLDQKNDRLFVNLPDANSIAVVKLSDFKLVDTWKVSERANYPMTLDTANNLVFVGYRRPAVLVGYDAITGKEQVRAELVSDVDDIFYYQSTKEVLASGGGGSINIFKTDNGKDFKQIANIPTRDGARTALLVPSLQSFILAERASGGKDAAIAVYKIPD